MSARTPSKSRTRKKKINTKHRHSTQSMSVSDGDRSMSEISTDGLQILDEHSTGDFRSSIFSRRHSGYLSLLGRRVLDRERRGVSFSYHIRINKYTTILIQLCPFNFNFLLIHTTACVFDQYRSIIVLHGMQRRGR